MITRLSKFFFYLFCTLLLGLATGCSTPSEPIVSDSLLANGDEQFLWQKAEEEQRVLENSDLCKKMVETNYDIATRCYSYSVLRQKLKNLIYDGIACNPENSSMNGRMGR